jgi:hypothetical protein
VFKLLVNLYWIVNFTVFSELTVQCKIYSCLQFIIMNILQRRVKCVVHWREGREGSFPERTGQPILPPTVCSMQYSLLHIAQYAVQFFVHCTLCK